MKKIYILNYSDHERHWQTWKAYKHKGVALMAASLLNEEYPNIDHVVVEVDIED